MGYRETEKVQWREENVGVVERLRGVASSAEKEVWHSTLEDIHVLDLAKDG